MDGIGYVLIWTLLIAAPTLALWKRRWWPSALYLVGILIFLYEMLKEKDGWDDLSDLATLIVVVIPIYIIASVLWVVNWVMKRKIN
ncbi:hypothetical protein [Cohnella sp.]|uniref:hypothetical protein n=1 Tax=Cohnella sp. TaxID=1883426 RepID=UPI003567D6A2